MTIDNLPAGVFDITADDNVIFVGSTTDFINAGTLSKIAGTGTSTFTDAIATTGTLTASIGTLELDGGGSLGGRIGATGAGHLVLGTGTFTLFGATQTISGALGISGGVVQIDPTRTLTLAGATTWDAGTQIDGTGALTTTGATGFTSDPHFDGSLVWNNSGTVTAAAQLDTDYNGATNSTTAGTVTINNLAGGVFDITADDLAIYVGSATNFRNTGTLEKSGGSGVSSIMAAVANIGTLAASTGTLELDGGGTLGGTVLQTAGGAVQFGGGAFAFAGSVATVGTLTFDNTATLAVGAVSGTISSASALGSTVTIAAGKTLTLAGATTWGTGTQIDGPGTLVTTGAVGFTTDPRTWPATWSGTTAARSAPGRSSIPIIPTPAARSATPGTVVINNQAGGAFDFTADQQVAIYSGATTDFNNIGTLAKTGGSGVSNMTLEVANTGTLAAIAGTTLELDGGGSLGAKNTITGAGVVAINGGTFTLAGTTASVTGALSVTGGVVQIDAGKTLTLSGANTWGTGTQINGPGTLATTGATGFTGDAHLDGSLVWNNSGTVSDGAQLDTDYGSGLGTMTINNLAGAAFDLTADGLGIYVGSTTDLNNSGTLAKTGGTGTSSINALLNSNGTLTAVTGTLELDGGGTFGATTTITGAGVVAIAAGIYTVGATTAAIAGALTLNGGTVQIGGGQTLTLAGAANWDGGTQIDGAGTLATTGTTSFIGSPNLDGSLVWNNSGTVSAGAQLDTGNPSNTGTETINNLAGGHFNLTADGAAIEIGTPAITNFNNAGTLAKTAGIGISTFAPMVVDHRQHRRATNPARSNSTPAARWTARSAAAPATVWWCSATAPASSPSTAAARRASRMPASSNDMRIVNGATWSDSGFLEAEGHIQIGNASGASAAGDQRSSALRFTTDDGGIVNGGGSTLINAGQIAKTSGTGTSVIGMGFSNTGTVLAESGTLKLAAAVSGNGLFVINAADTLELASGAVAGGNTIGMGGFGARRITLRIDTNTSVGKPIIGLGAGSRIDLAAATFAAGVAAVINGNTLTITPTGGSALNFVSTDQPRPACVITKSSDGGAGLVTPYSAGPPRPPPVVATQPESPSASNAIKATLGTAVAGGRRAR